MLSAFILNVCSYPTLPAVEPTIGTPEKHRSKSFRTKDPSSFDYSSVRKIGTILTLVVLTFCYHYNVISIVCTIDQTMLSSDCYCYPMLNLVDKIILVVVRYQIIIYLMFVAN
jgi:hypothetical protein